FHNLFTFNDTISLKKYSNARFTIRLGDLRGRSVGGLHSVGGLRSVGDIRDDRKGRPYVRKQNGYSLIFSIFLWLLCNRSVRQMQSGGCTLLHRDRNLRPVFLLR
ncbi:hypothetical protein EZS27_043700, partial [termite gut metagenome]